MKKVVLIILAIIISLSINAQDNIGPKRNNIFLELGGAGLIGSVNYERMLTDNVDLNFPLRIGVLYLYSDEMPCSSHTLIVPMSISVIKKIAGSDNLYWELKAITSYFHQNYKYSDDPKGRWSEHDNKTTTFIPGASFGLRRNDFFGGFYYHLHFQINYNKDDDSETELSPWFSVGLGHTF